MKRTKAMNDKMVATRRANAAAKRKAEIKWVEAKPDIAVGMAHMQQMLDWTRRQVIRNAITNQPTVDDAVNRIMELFKD